MSGSAASVTRFQVLQLYRILLRTKKKVFSGDKFALEAARKKIREEFVKNKDEKDPKKVGELLQLGYEVEKLLRTTVVQAKRTPDGNYRVRLTNDTLMGDNVPFHDR